jgi:hypothetical protein
MMSSFFLFAYITTLAVATFLSATISWQSRELGISEITWSTNQYGLGCDPSRFLLQAFWLSEGYGFREASPTGNLCTSLPPGHPVALSLLFHFTNDVDKLRYLQCLLPFFSGLLIFFSLRDYAILRYFTSFLLASSPWLTALSSCHMSETTSTFLVALLTFIISWYFCNPILSVNTTPNDDTSQIGKAPYLIRSNSRAMFFSGSTASLIILTAPGLIFSVLSLTLLLAYRSRSNWRELLCAIIGLSIPLTIWQIHCISATGRPALGLLTPLAPSMNDEKAWVRTWARTPKETITGYRNFAWNVDKDFADVPDYAFLSRSEKDDVIAAYLRAIDPKLSPEEAEEAEKARETVLSNATSHRKAQRPFEVWLMLPIRRGVLSWLEQQPVSFHGHDSPENIQVLAPWNLISDTNQRGIYRATLRASRGAYSLFVMALHYATVIIIGYTIFNSLKRASWATSLIVGSLLIYTYLHGLDGPECRRNLPFLPLLFCLPAIAANLTPTGKNANYKPSEN